MTRAIELLGRTGLAARGVIYFLVGMLALLAGAGFRGGAADQRQAISVLHRTQFGDVALWIVAGGLAAFIGWRIAQILFTDKWSTRGMALISSTAYSGVVATAVMQALGGGSSGSGERGIEKRAGWLLSQPMGQWLLVAAGLLVVGVAVYQFARAYRATFAKHLRGGDLTQTQEIWACRAGRIGFSARGVALALIGTFLIRAALQKDPSEAGGLGAALASLAAQPLGSLLLAAAGVGLAAFGIWSLMEARYRTKFI